MLRYLVDGNNLLHAACDHEPDRPPGRSLLCARLGQWVRHRPNRRRLTVVFDGRQPDPDRSAQIADEALAVLYSGVGTTADELIVERIRSDGTPRTLCVVSTDRQIRRAARVRGARSLRSDEFWDHVVRELSRPQDHRAPLPPEKLHGLTPEQTEAWLRDMGFDDPRGQPG